MSSWPPITRDDLRHAAGSAGFDTVFPLLVRRLIAETGVGVSVLDMPGGSGTAAGGFDGVVTAAEQTAFVPEGTSVWELSVTPNAQKKANDDYDKRALGPEGAAPGDVTYVQVILAPWTKARAWAKEKNADGVWKEVRAYNLDQLDAWLDSAPATAAWLAEQLGKALPGVRPVGAWWSDTWLPSTRVPLTTAIVLAGRETATASFLELLSRGQRMITLGGDLRLEEARVFVAACLDQAGTADAAALMARALFVSDGASLARLVGQPGPLILLPADSTLTADLPIHERHQFVLPAPPGENGDVTVPPLNSQIVWAQLQASGLPPSEAWDMSTLARRSLLALRRRLAVDPVRWTPSWASHPEVVRRRLLLLGGWDGTNDNDRRIVAECVGRPYQEIREAARELAAVRESPFLGNLEERWHVLSPQDSWSLLGAQLTHDDLEAFQTAVLEVLSESSPSTGSVEVPLWERVRPQFSAALRRSLAQSLALLGASGTLISAPGKMSGSSWVRLPIRELLKRANADDTYALWTSLGDVLPLIAEAAPEEFLEAVAAGLAGPSPLHSKMFTDATRDDFGFGGVSPHTAFLQALECLGWSPDHFYDVVDALASLAALDPGGHWSNRPLRSLTEILSWWSPNTMAGPDQRAQALKRLRRRREVARAVLIELVPDGRKFQLEHPGPRFRDWKHEVRPSPPEQTSAFTLVIDLLFEDLDDDLDRHLMLLGKIDLLPPARRAEFRKRLAEFGGSASDDEIRSRLSDALRGKISRHREYADASWALPEEELRDLESVAATIRPRDPVRRAQWLFATDWLEIGDPSLRDDHEAHHVAVTALRTAAIADVLRERGLPAIMGLASQTDYPHLVGSALARQGDAFDGEMLTLLGSSASPDRHVAFAYISQRLREDGPSPCDRLLGRTDDPLTQARILNAHPEKPSSWEQLERLPAEVNDRYWREFSCFGLGKPFPHALRAARSLSGVGRHAAALDLISLYREDNQSAEAAKAVAEALEGLLSLELKDPEIARLNSYVFKHLFTLLAEYREEVGRERVLFLEWQYFPALGFDADAPSLHTALAEDPAFFAEIIGYVYRVDQTDESLELPESKDDAARRLAAHAYDVLRQWRRCPGVTPEGQMDSALLRDWATDAREKLRTNGRLKSGDIEIGQILAHTPADDTGLFPPEAVRDLLEEIQSDDIDTGLQIGILNKRDVTVRGLYDGGMQERELADSYREQVSTSLLWPRTRKLLIRIADFYELEARREEEEAERRRRGL